MASKWQEIEARFGRPMAQIILGLYEKHGPGTRQDVIAQELGVSQPTLSQWMKLIRASKVTQPDPAGALLPDFEEAQEAS